MGGKVGDTISATVEPSNATNVTFAWYVGDSATTVDTAIEGATTASLAVTDAMVGKFIKVVVNGDDASSATATTTKAVEAQATEKIAIASAKQTGAATIEVKVNKPIAAGTFDISLSKGTTAQTITTTIDDAGTTIVITNGVALSQGEYTVKITSKTDATESAESKVTCEKSELKEIKFLGDELILTDSSLKEAKTTLKGYDQYEKEVSLTGSLTVTATKGKATYTAKDSKITVDSTYGGTAPSVVFTPGEKITVTAIYTSGTTVLQIAKELTVSAVATLTTFETGDIATTDTTLKGKKVTMKNFSSNTYYLPVKVAKDQYNNDLTADDLNKMMKVTAGGNLYINPVDSTKAGATVYVDKFEKLKDGTIAMNLKKGGLSIPGKNIITITGIAGYSGSVEVNVEDNPHVAKLSVSAPNLYSGVPSVIDVTAVDQYGEAFDLYDYVADGTYSAGAALVMTDKNNLTQMTTTITPSYAGSNLVVKKNTAKKTVEFTYKPATGATAKHNEILTVVTAEGTPDTITWSVDTKPTPEALGDLTGKVKTTFQTGETGAALKTVLSDKTVKILDSSGAVVDYNSNVGGIARVNFVPAGVTNVTAGAYYAVVTGVTNMAASNNGGTPSEVAITANVAAGGSYTVKVELFKAKTTESTTAAKALESLGTALSSKEYTFVVVDNATQLKYAAKLATGSELLYVNKDSRDESGFTVTKTDTSGRTVACAASEYDVTVDSGLKVTASNTISGAVSTLSGKGSAKARIWVDGEVINTIDVPYDTAAPAPQKQVQFKGTDAVTTTDFTGITDATLGSDGVMTISDGADSWTLYIIDQYGLPMANSAWAIGGKAFADMTLADGTYALTATSNTTPGSWSLTSDGLSGITCVAPATANTLASISTSAVDGSADPIATDAISWNDAAVITVTGTTSGGNAVASADFTPLKVVNASGVDKTGKFTLASGKVTCKTGANAPEVGTYTATVVSTTYAVTKTFDFKINKIAATNVNQFTMVLEGAKTALAADSGSVTVSSGVSQFGYQNGADGAFTFVITPATDNTTVAADMDFAIDSDGIITFSEAGTSGDAIYVAATGSNTTGTVYVKFVSDGSDWTQDSAALTAPVTYTK